MPAAQKVVLGLMTWGKEGTPGARVHSVKDCEEILDVFVGYGHNEVDSSRAYCGGTTDETFGNCDWKSRGIVVDTKLYPYAPIDHTEECMRENLEIQLKAIKTDCIDTWYLHGPDRATPFEETLRGIDKLYKEGKFKRFGVSNYMSWEVAEIVVICEKNGWIKPTVYQGVYNALHRNVEPELFPCLRKFGLSFYEFNPLGGGFFVGRFDPEKSVEKGSRFDADSAQGKFLRNRYWNDSYFQALEKIGPVANQHNLDLPEVALRWMSHHSMLSKEKGDAILVGASSVGHLESNLQDLEKGPLPQDVVEVLDDAWELVKPVATKSLFVGYGHNEVDSSRAYCGGTTDETFGNCDWKSRGIVVDTKLYPYAPIDHTEECMRENLEIQLKAIKTDCIDTWYLHGPDRATPFEETLRGIDKLYKEGKFKRFGVSNYMSWEVAEIVVICEKNGWIKPTVYQGVYNALHRNVEPELFPCLRKFGLSFYEFNPLGGGFFVGRFDPEKSVEKGSRFDADSAQGKFLRNRYWNDSYFQALEKIGPVANQHNLDLPEVALRWMSHHSMLSKEKGDAILVGASSVGHLESNLQDLEKGPLPQDVVEVLDDAWELVKPVATKYWH